MAATPSQASFRAYRVHAAGEPAVLDAMAVDELSVSDVVVAVTHSAINYKDALAMTGRGKIVRRFPCVVGIDLAGTVVASADSRFAIGQEVLATGYDLGVSHDGGYAERARVPSDWLVALPNSLSAFNAMAFGTAGFTAALAVRRLRALGLETHRGPIAVTGASGGVGRFAVAMLAQLGFEVVAITGKPDQHEALLRLGAARVLSRPDTSRVRALDAATWAAAIDNIGGAYLPWLLSQAKRDGFVASVGNAAGGEFAGSVYPFILRGVSLVGIDSAMCPQDVRHEIWADLAGPRWSSLPAAFAHAVTFADVPAACAEVVEGRSKGRYVVTL